MDRPEKKKIRISVVKHFGEILNDMDDAHACYYLIFDCLKNNQIPVVDFSGVKKLHSYWLVISLGRYVTKLREKTNEYIKVYGLNKTNMKILNEVAANALQNGNAVLSGVDTSSVQDDEDIVSG